MLKIFLSYAREDLECVNSVFNMLEAHGFKPWMDKKRLLPGQDWQQEIVKSIKNSDVFIVFFSSSSVGKRGVFQKELKHALNQLEYLLENDVFILPIVLDDCEVPEKFRRFQWIHNDDADFTANVTNALNIVAAQKKKFSYEGRLVKYHTREEEYPSLKVRCTFPQLESQKSDPRVEQVNSIISGQINASIFREKRFYGPQDELLGNDTKSELSCFADVALLSRNFISVYLQHYTYGNGAAHGNHAAKTLNINILDGISFSFLDIVEQGEKFVTDSIDVIDKKYGLSNALNSDRSHLKKSIEFSMENRFKVSIDGISLYFDPYEIFAYAIGIIDISFSWSQLREYQLTDLGRKIMYDLKDKEIGEIA